MFEDRPSEWTLYVQVTNEGEREQDVRVHWKDSDGRNREGEIGDLGPGESNFFGVRQREANIPDRGRMYVTARRGGRRSRRLIVPYEREPR